MWAGGRKAGSYFCKMFISDPGPNFLVSVFSLAMRLTWQEPLIGGINHSQVQYTEMDFDWDMCFFIETGIWSYMESLTLIFDGEIALQPYAHIYIYTYIYIFVCVCVCYNQEKNFKSYQLNYNSNFGRRWTPKFGSIWWPLPHGGEWIWITASMGVLVHIGMGL